MDTTLLVQADADRRQLDGGTIQRRRLFVEPLTGPKGADSR